MLSRKDEYSLIASLKLTYKPQAVRGNPEVEVKLLFNRELRGGNPCHSLVNFATYFHSPVPSFVALRVENIRGIFFGYKWEKSFNFNWHNGRIGEYFCSEKEGGWNL